MAVSEGENAGNGRYKGVVALIPAYKPDEGMLKLVSELQGRVGTILVVDDGCGPEYEALFGKLPQEVVLLRHEVNKGKGRALKTGFSYVTQHLPGADCVVTMDADGQHTVKDTLRCVDAFLEDPSYSVFGCRDFLSDNNIPARSLFGNRLTSKVLKFFCDITLSDTQTGLRVLPLSCLSALARTKGERYEYEMNMILDLKEQGVPLKEVPISVIYIENNASSHFNPIVDSIKIYRVFLGPFAKFILSSVSSFVVDISAFHILQMALKTVIPGFYIEAATGVARILSGVYNYSVNRLIFKGRNAIKGSALRYLILWLALMLCSAFGVKTLVYLLHSNETITKMILDTILFLISFKIQQRWVFKRKEKV